MSASVTRSRDHQQIAVQLKRLSAADDALDVVTRRSVIGMHDSIAIISIAKQLVIGHVVFVRQQHLVNAAKRVDPFNELRREAWRVDQQVTAFVWRSGDQVAPRTETVFGSEAAKINVLRQLDWKGVDADVRVVFFGRTDGAGRASYERHHGLSRFIRGFGLMINAALVAVVAKDRGRELTTSVAVDAGGIYKEIARHILR